MTEQQLVEQGYELIAALGPYRYFRRGTIPTDLILHQDGTVRAAIYSPGQSNEIELLRDLCLKRILEIVVQLPGVASYPTISQELGAIGDSLALRGEVLLSG